MQDFVHLHVHTQYSILDGQASIPRLVDKAIADGMKGIAVTDHGDMFGIKEFFNYVNKKNGGTNGEIKDLKKKIAGLEKGTVECENPEAGCGSHQAADSGTRVERCTACLLSRCCSVCAAGHPRLFSQKSEAVPQILRCAGGLTERQSQDRYDGYRPCSFGRSEAVYLYPYRKPIDLQINRKKSNLISKIHNVNDCKLSKPTKNFFWRLHS